MFGISRGCLIINSRLSPHFAFFLLHLFLIVLYLQLFAYLHLCVRFLRFSVGNTRVVTVIVVWFSSPFFQFTIGMFSISVFSSFVFALLVVSGLLGKLFATGCRCWFLGVFFGGFFYCVLGVFRVSVAPLHFLWVVDPSLG